MDQRAKPNRRAEGRGKQPGSVPTCVVTLVFTVIEKRGHCPLASSLGWCQAGPQWGVKPQGLLDYPASGLGPQEPDLLICVPPIALDPHPVDSTGISFLFPRWGCSQHLMQNLRHL